GLETLNLQRPSQQGGAGAHSLNRRAGCVAHKSGSVRGVPGNRGLYSAGKRAQAQPSTHWGWAAAATPVISEGQARAAMGVAPRRGAVRRAALARKLGMRLASLQWSALRKEVAANGVVAGGRGDRAALVSVEGI
ncbi:MAG TPA: hypothetical protein VI197_03090, partial [Polyangiaceae bacterium]